MVGHGRDENSHRIYEEDAVERTLVLRQADVTHVSTGPTPHPL